MRRLFSSVILSGLALCAGAWLVVAAEKETASTDSSSTAASSVDFTRDIKPIFAQRCVSCHGPDTAEASLRLDNKRDALRGGNSGPSMIAGEADKSRLFQYVAGTAEDETIMPPEGERLSAEQVALIRTWVNQGAKWPDEAPAARPHSDLWSLQPITRPTPPQVKQADWARNPIDRFILAKLEAEGIKPSPEADAATLCRRLYLDLTGLPPNPEEIDEFARSYSKSSQHAEKAYTALVDKLLASPHYGERWARHWLDVARYADSDGYEKDTGRPYAWRWRGWVIDALNRDLPFDQFTVEQLAGDLLADPTLEQKIATGFHRNTLTNKEGGVDQEEYRVAATVDRVNTTGTVWLGLTVGCAQCHTHKYDPISQREYYELFAFFNNVDETDIPAVSAADLTAHKAKKAEFDAEHASLVEAVEQYERDLLPKHQAAWEKKLQSTWVPGAESAKPQNDDGEQSGASLRSAPGTHAESATSTTAAWQALEPVTMTADKTNVKFTHVGDGVITATGDSPATATYTIKARTPLRGITALRLEALAEPDKSAGPGRAPSQNFVLSELKVQAKSLEGDEKATAQSLRWAMADFAQKSFPVEGAIDADTKTGWAVGPKVKQDHVLVVEFAKPVDFADGAELTITLDHQYKQKYTLSRFRLSVTASPTPFVEPAIVDSPAAALAKSADDRSDAEREQLTKYYRRLDPQLRKLDQAVADHKKKEPADPASTNKAPTLAEREKLRETHVLVRGDFLRPGAAVDADTLQVMPELKTRSSRPDRLDLAQWLVSKDNPLTARVTVNRIWGHYFGRAIVPTVQDFGTQGDKPSHPELLDWLADYFRQSWSMKQLHRLIVTSATYRQSSNLREDLIERDPYNALLSQQRRLRVEAEVVRDLALASCGLLDERIGGPSVRPRQPDGIAELTYANSNKWVESTGADRYRRGLYTWFQRTSPYPMLMTFDSPDGTLCCVRRERSNTPLQALTLLNDPVFVECAQALGRRIVREAPTMNDPDSTTTARLRYAFKLCVSREPTSEELDSLEALFDDQVSLASADKVAAAAIVGKSPKPDGASDAELAGWIMVGRTLLNLDEFITRE